MIMERSKARRRQDYHRHTRTHIHSLSTRLSTCSAYRVCLQSFWSWSPWFFGLFSFLHSFFWSSSFDCAFATALIHFGCQRSVLYDLVSFVRSSILVVNVLCCVARFSFWAHPFGRRRSVVRLRLRLRSSISVATVLWCVVYSCVCAKTFCQSSFQFWAGLLTQHTRYFRQNRPFTSIPNYNTYLFQWGQVNNGGKQWSSMEKLLACLF